MGSVGVDSCCQYHTTSRTPPWGTCTHYLAWSFPFTPVPTTPVWQCRQERSRCACRPCPPANERTEGASSRKHAQHLVLSCLVLERLRQTSHVSSLHPPNPQSTLFMTPGPHQLAIPTHPPTRFSVRIHDPFTFFSPAPIFLLAIDVQRDGHVLLLWEHRTLYSRTSPSFHSSLSLGLEIYSIDKPSSSQSANPAGSCSPSLITRVSRVRRRRIC